MSSLPGNGRNGIKQANRFYDRENWSYASDREKVQVYQEWLSPIPWTLFCIFTFAWGVSDPQAIKTFDAFMRRLEQLLRCDVAYIRGDEKRSSGHGKAACARHFHVLIACAAPVSPQLTEALWMSMAGNRSDNAGAQVKAYDPSQNGISYVLKGICQGDGDWAFRKLHLFLPSWKGGKLNCRQRRVLRRHNNRLQSFGSLKAGPQ